MLSPGIAIAPAAPPPPWSLCRVIIESCAMRGIERAQQFWLRASTIDSPGSSRAPDLEPYTVRQYADIALCVFSHALCQ